MFRLKQDGDTTNELARYLRWESTYRRDGRTLSAALEPFRPARYAHGASFGFVWCDAESFSCDQWIAEGKKLRSLRVHLAKTPVTDADVAAWKEWRTARITEAKVRADFEKSVAEADKGATVPFFSLYRVDSEDRIWFRAYDRLGVIASNHWSVMAPDGTVLGTIVLPAMENVLRMGAGVIIGTERDEHGAQVLTVFRYTMVQESARRFP